jgi:TM2 domain-containing membrane protein YozV
VPVDVPRFPDGKPAVDAQGRAASPKSRLAAALLCWFLGVFGVHRYYVGKIGTGLLMLVTLGGLGLWALIDFIVILVGSFKDKQERVLSNW